MADVYKVSLSWDGVSVTGDQPPSMGGTRTLGSPRPRVFLMAKNWFGAVSTGVPVLKAWAIHGYIFNASDGMGSTEYRAQFVAKWWNELTSDHSDDEERWDFVQVDLSPPVFHATETLRITEGPGSNGAGYLGGGTISIEKDEAANEMRFITPIGTMVHPLHWTGANPNVTDFDEENALGLYFMGHGHHLQRPEFSTEDTQATIKFYDAINRKNGVITDQIAMSAADPGAWFPTETRTDIFAPYASGSEGYDNGLGPAMDTDDGQEATRYRMKVSWETTDDPLISTVTRHWRLLSAGGTGQNFRDMTHADEHGPIWATYVLPTDISKIKLRRTFDNFHSSSVTDAYDSIMSANESPNICWYDDRLWLVWYDGTVIKQSFSQDWGITWSTAVDLMIAGTNPRHLVDRSSGLSYYFYIDSFQSLVLKRSGDFGKSFIDGTAITVQTNVGLQTVAAEFTSSGELVAGWIDAMSGDWVQLRSQDRGLTWI